MPDGCIYLIRLLYVLCNPPGFRTYDAPGFPGDMPGRWFGLHYHDYSVDTFH